MCILVTRRYRCVTRAGQPVESQTHHQGRWIQPCSSPPPPTAGGAGAQQACLTALDEQDEWYDHPCPDCTGHSAASDGISVRTESRAFPRTASDAGRAAFARVINTYAQQLARLFHAWISDHWRRPGDYHDGNGDPALLAERNAIVARELTCREDPSHGPHHPDAPFCGCTLAAAPLIQNLASQRRRDMALQSAAAALVLGRGHDMVDLGDGGGDGEGSDPGDPGGGGVGGGGPGGDAAVGELMRTRVPPVLGAVMPFGAAQLAARWSRLQGLRDNRQSEDGSPWDAIYCVLRDISWVLAIDTGLTLARAGAIFGMLQARMLDRATRIRHARPWYLEDALLDADRPWINRLSDLLANNAHQYFDLYGYEMTFLLDHGAQEPVRWCPWLAPIRPSDRHGFMTEEWGQQGARLHARLQSAEENIVDFDPATMPPGARCFICTNDFVSDNPPFDVPAAPHRCAGAHTAAAGRRCLVCFAGTTSNVPSCPICRRPYDEEDDDAPA
ncbi:hypothetical protein QBC33DRAFT_512680 [Phialemonium atrogriseum]|uniref:Uncharacterized protein n=1 Tax=Phialemonium atrogriseum TaxID=1093897 RepID=A0AAJ0C4X7_9PEZI|nr:uncharacterized protein QBC33DRAFT_512680 [Phialemonium atrogriseum]KAK1770011.1 hypothetical protein QBC33DRAFT_512680 [Phialemonium atrogriseum]